LQDPYIVELVLRWGGGIFGRIFYINKSMGIEYQIKILIMFKGSMSSVISSHRLQVAGHKRQADLLKQWCGAQAQYINCDLFL